MILIAGNYFNDEDRFRDVFKLFGDIWSYDISYLSYDYINYLLRYKNIVLNSTIYLPTKTLRVAEEQLCIAYRF